MGATVNIQEGNGASVTWTTITAGRYCTEDAYNPGTTDPCVVPDSGLNYSFWKHHSLSIGGSYTQITNIRWYTDGAIGWTLGTNGLLGVGLRDSGDNGCPAANYQQALGTVGTTGYYLKDNTNGHAYYKGQTAGPGNAQNYTAGSPLTIDNTTTYTGTVTATKSCVSQVIIDTDATQGTQAAETFTFKWDEI